MVIVALFLAVMPVIGIAACGWQMHRMLTADFLRLAPDESATDAREGSDADHDRSR